MADQMTPLEWTTRGLAAARCDVLASELAHVYHCCREGIRDGNESLTIVWPDGTVRDYLAEMEGLGMFGRTESYY